MNTCKTCRYWIKPENDYVAESVCDPIDPDTDEPMKMEFEVRLCKMQTQTFAEFPVERNGFGLVDASEYRAVLFTAEDFGCVRHTIQEYQRV